MALLKSLPLEWSGKHVIDLDEELTSLEETDLIGLLSYMKFSRVDISLKLRHSLSQYKPADSILKTLKNAR